MALADSIIGVESGGDPNAQNPNSSAGGLGQFIDSTWLAMLAKHRPDIQGTPDQLLALKNDPNLSRQMTAAYSDDNGKLLQNAGFEASPGNSYLAHFAGPQGAIKVLGADPAAPVSSILGDAAVKANPFLRGMTAADLQAWAARKMGGAANAPASSQAASSAPTAQLPPSMGAPAVPQQQEQPQPQPQAGAGSFYSQLPIDQAPTPPPIFYAPRKPVSIANLQAALKASGNRGLIT